MMKKLLLLSCFLMAINSNAQDFWTQYATGQPAASTGMNSISIVDQNVTWLNMSCGTTGCAPIRRYAKTVNGGTVWTTGEINLGPQTTELIIANIQGISASVAFAVAYPKSPGVIGGVWKTVDGGTTWSRQEGAAYSGDNYSFPTLLHFWNANEGVVMGDPVDGNFEVYTTSNGGDTWTRIVSPALVPIDVEEYLFPNVFTITGNTIWAFTTLGRLLKSADRGLTWTVSQSPILDFMGTINGTEPPDLAFTDENNGLLQGSDYLLYSTDDGGATWAEMLWTGEMRNFAIAAVPGMHNTYISLGESLEDSPQRGSSYSIDGGATWIDINNNPDTDFVRGGVIEMLNENYGFASDFSATPTEGGIHLWGGGPMLRTAHLAVSFFSTDKSINVAPNPTSGVLKINGENITRVAVCDILGKQITVSDYNAVDTINLNLDPLANGVYLISISNEDATTVTKVVKQ